MNVDSLAARLALSPHPEGGLYRETFRSAACSLIYYLLRAGEFSAWHRVRARDEIWHHYRGGPLALHVVHPDGRYERTLLGVDAFQAVVPADAWQAAEPLDEPALVGCTVAPPFDFAAFELPDRTTLRALLPATVPDELLERLTR